VGRGASLLLNLPPDRRGRIPENDIKSLRDFRHIIDKTFSEDLARGSKVTTGNTRGAGGDVRFLAQNVVDGQPNTYWATDDSVKSSVLILDFDKSKTFNVIRIREYLPLGQRVEAFALDRWHQNKWIEFAQGTSIGNCRLVRCESVTSNQVRLRIAQAAACPAISEFAFFMIKI